MMDRSDSKASSVDRRLSRRVSRAASVQATGGEVVDETVNETTNEPDELHQQPHQQQHQTHEEIPVPVADGFRPHRPSISSSIIPSEGEHLTLAPSAPSSSSSSSSSSSFPSSNDITISVTPPETADSETQVPPQDAQAAQTAQTTQTAQTAQPDGAVQAQAKLAGMQNRPSSISKPPLGSALGMAGLTTRQRGGSNTSTSGSSTSGTAVADDATSAASSTGVAAAAAAAAGSVSPASMHITPDEPYQGPSGPSFPYQMYPQNVRVERSLSSATASTAVHSESSYNGPRGPTFPYTLYPQNTMAGPSAIPMGTIPVGFPGMSDNYQRRIGPDGEEIADMIGPDGHTEQLPPYSRYPDDAYSRKVAAAMGAAAVGPQPEGAVAAAAAAPGGTEMTAATSVPNTTGTPNVSNTTNTNTPTAEQTREAPGTTPVAANAEADTVSPTAASAATAATVAAAAVAAGTAAAATAGTGTTPATAATTDTTAAAAATTAAVPSLRPIPGAGGLGLAPRNPEFDELESPQSRHSSRSFTSDNSRHEINTAATGAVDEKDEKDGKKRTKLQKLARRRLWGIIPYWAICLMVTAVILVGVIIGGVIGGFMARHRKPPNRYRPTATGEVTVTVDATPIPAPTNLSPLPTGTYGLPLSLIKSPATCFNDTTQSSSWSCELNMMANLSVTITDVAPSPEREAYNISINCNESMLFSSGVVFYGEQPPLITTSTDLQLVNDTLEPGRGPAWFKMFPYNKTVIIPESFLSAPENTVSKREGQRRRQTVRRDRLERLEKLGRRGSSVGGFDINSFYRKGVAKAGERPWVCTWPDTLLEVFIYANQNTSMYRFSLSKTARASTTTTATPLFSTTATGGASTAASTAIPTVAGTSSSKALYRVQNYFKDGHGKGLDEGAVSTTPTPTPTPTPGVVDTQTQTQTQTTNELSSKPPAETTTTTTEPAATTTSTSTTTASQSSQSSQSSRPPHGIYPPPPLPYPRIIKVEERRMDGSREATCTQYELLSSGNGVAGRPLLDDNGDTIEILIVEEEPGPPMDKRSLEEGIVDAAELFRRQDDDLSDCGCLWMVT